MAMTSTACTVLVGSARAVIGSLSMAQCMVRLSPEEQVRARSFRFDADRQSYVAAHLLVRRAAGLLTGRPAHEFELMQRCDTCGGPHGRPHIKAAPELFVSLSHVRNGVAAAASYRPVGIDMEMREGHSLASLRSEAAFSATELERLDRLDRHDPAAAESLALQWWVRKECLIKLGRLTLDTLTRVEAAAELPAGLAYWDWCHGPSRCVGAVVTTELARSDSPSFSFFD